MDYEEEKVLEDNYADALSDVPEDSDLEDTSESDIESDTESLDSGIITEVQRSRRIRLLSSDSEESDVLINLDWTELDEPVNNEIVSGTPGPTVIPINNNKVEEFVDMFIGNDLFEFIATETNRYHRQNCDKHKKQKKRCKWFDVTASELKKWFALIIVMGFSVIQEIDDYWSTNPLIENPIFNKTMSRKRFRQIFAFIHFANNANMPGNANRLFKVQYLIDYFSKKFEDNFNLSQNISIHKGMIPWQRLSFKPYDQSKITTYGILVRMLCDSASGYISSFKLYSGVGQTGRPILNPRILPYNKDMKRVKRADKYLSCYPMYSKTIKWSKKVTLYLFNCSLFNAFSVYKHMNVSCGETMRFRDFLLHTATYWLQDTHTEENFENPTTSTHRHHDPPHRPGNLNQHKLIPISTTNKHKRRRCHVCYSNKKRKTTNLMCKSCKVALHLGNCFANYHRKGKH